MLLNALNEIMSWELPMLYLSTERGKSPFAGILGLKSVCSVGKVQIKCEYLKGFFNIRLGILLIFQF